MRLNTQNLHCSLLLLLLLEVVVVVVVVVAYKLQGKGMRTIYKIDIERQGNSLFWHTCSSLCDVKRVAVSQPVISILI